MNRDNIVKELPGVELVRKESLQNLRRFEKVCIISYMQMTMNVKREAVRSSGSQQKRCSKFLSKAGHCNTTQFKCLVDNPVIFQFHRKDNIQVKSLKTERERTHTLLVSQTHKSEMPIPETERKGLCANDGHLAKRPLNLIIWKDSLNIVTYLYFKQTLYVLLKLF